MKTSGIWFKEIVLDNNKVNIKVTHYWSFVRESTDDWLVALTNAQKCSVSILWHLHESHHPARSLASDNCLGSVHWGVRCNRTPEAINLSLCGPRGKSQLGVIGKHFRFINLLRYLSHIKLFMIFFRDKLILVFRKGFPQNWRLAFIWPQFNKSYPSLSGVHLSSIVNQCRVN